MGCRIGHPWDVTKHLVTLISTWVACIHIFFVGSKHEVLIVKDNLGLLLREAWAAKGNAGCLHAELSLERSFSGTVTGRHICTICGQALECIVPSSLIKRAA
jgi:hypothetical protein